jgi:hypothetical protein
LIPLSTYKYLVLIGQSAEWCHPGVVQERSGASSLDLKNERGQYGASERLLVLESASPMVVDVEDAAVDTDKEEYEVISRPGDHA